MTPVSETVQVSAIDSCSSITCPSYLPLGVSPTATRFVLVAAGGPSWTLYLAYTALPSDLIQLGDTIDLTVQARLEGGIVAMASQTIVLSHGADMVLFAYTRVLLDNLRPPDLTAFGVTVTDDGARCGTESLDRVARVQVGNDSARIARGTARIGWLTFTLQTFRQGAFTGGSDISSQARMAGFRVAEQGQRP